MPAERSRFEMVASFPDGPDVQGVRATTATVVLGVAALVALLVAVLGVNTASAVVLWPTHRCGSFIREAGKSEGVEYPRYRITVYNSDGLACRLATEVIEAFWDPDETHRHHGGPSDVKSWYTTSQFPKWRCVQGAGGGGCLHKHKVAGYSVKNA